MNEPCEWPTEHDATALVVVLQVVLPRIAHVVVTADPAERRATARPWPSSLRNPASVTCRYIGAYSRQTDPKRANCCRMTFSSAGSGAMSLVGVRSVDTVG